MEIIKDKPLKSSGGDREVVPPGVVICILNWNGWQDTIECVESVCRLHYAHYLTVVVDNGSLNDSLARLRAWGKERFREPGGFVEYRRDQAEQGGDTAREAQLDRCAASERFVLIDSQENLGFNGGCNLVFRYALTRPEPADYVFLLNSDAFPEPDCVAHLVETDRKSGAGIVGAVIKNRENGEIFFAGNRGSFPLLREFFGPLITWHPVVPDPTREFEPAFFSWGTGEIIRRDVLERVYQATGHYFEESLFMYGDEVEFAERARKHGFHTVIANRAVVNHGRCASSGGLNNPIVNYYPIRNRVQQARHMLPWYLLPGFHVLHISWNLGRALHNLRKGRRQSALAIVRGLLDGYRGVTGKWRRHDQEVLSWRKARSA